MTVSNSKLVLVSLLSQLSKIDLDPEKTFFSDPVPINTQYNTRIKVSPDASIPFYFGSWFNYNRLDFTHHTEIKITLNGETKLSQLLDKITLAGEFTIVVGTYGASVDATITVDDILESDLPPLPPGAKTTVQFVANPMSYLYTGWTYITLQG